MKCGVPAAVVDTKHGGHAKSSPGGPTITILGTAAAGGYEFTNFNGPYAGTSAAAGTNMNGISNSGVAVGFDIDNNGEFHNFLVNPLKSKLVTELNINGSTAAMALGTDAEGTVVGTDGNGNAFYENHGKVTTFIPLGGTSAVAFGINDRAEIVGQSMLANGTTPGWVRLNNNLYDTINAPSGSSSDVVNAQSINNRGQVVGFYLGNDGQVHGFMANTEGAKARRSRAPRSRIRRSPMSPANRARRSSSRKSWELTTKASRSATTVTRRPANTASSTTPTLASTRSSTIPLRRSTTA